MNRLNLTTLLLGVLTIASCKKSVTKDELLPASVDSRAKQEECQPRMFNLEVDSVSGVSYVNIVIGSPSAGPVNVIPYILSGTNQLTTCNNEIIRFVTGLAYDPASHIFYGTTGIHSRPTPNAILTFTDPNCVTVTPAINTCGIPLDLSDVERDQTSGGYYAINRGTANPNNRVVRLALPGSPAVTCLPAVLPPTLNLRGLTFECGGRLFLTHTSGISATLLAVDKTTGALLTTLPYPGPVALSPIVPGPELGLHFDCACNNKFITAGFNPVSSPLMTDGLPAGMGGPIFSSLVNALRPTVDFARQ